MIRKNKWKIIISSIITLLPILFGIIVWDKLPEQMAIHWGVGGNPDHFVSAALAVFALPVFLFIMNWVCILVTCLDYAGQRDAFSKRE